MKQHLINFYLEYWEDFLTVENFADFHNIETGEAKALLNLGKKYLQERRELKQLQKQFKHQKN